jgi:hypothetical protein
MPAVWTEQIRNILDFSNKTKMVKVRKEFIFRFFFYISAVYSNTFLAALKPPLESSGKLVGSDGSDDPFPDLLEAVLSQGEAGQPLLHSPKQEKSTRAGSGK